MTCAPEQRDRALQLHRRLDRLDCVAAVDVLEPAMGPRNAWSVEAIVEGRAIPHAVLQAVADAEADLHPDAPGDQYCKLVATI